MGVLFLNRADAKELHDLLFTFMGQFHEKIILKFRQETVVPPWVKKNHAKIINILYQNDNLTLTEIGKRLDIEKGSLTTLIDQLEEKDFVIRSDDPEDRRKSLISLSERGRVLMDRLMDVYAQKLNEILSTADPSEIKQFIASLQFAVEFMKKV